MPRLPLLPIRWLPAVSVTALLMASLYGCPLLAAEGDPPKLYDSNELMDLTLTGPWRKLGAESRREDNSYPATLSWANPDGSQQQLAVQVAPRGLTRRYKICAFPPLKFDFDKEAAKGTPFQGQSDLKLVTWCTRSATYQTYNQLEYLVYRIYNHITPYSLKVRALNANWQESGRGSVRESFAFFIEDIDKMAKRMGLEELDILEIEPEQLDAGVTARFALFQFLVGNLDWAALGGPDGEMCCHNGKLIGSSPDAETLFAIPYDFDSAGLVDASYAAPPEGLKVRSVTDRMYRGFCAHNAELPAARAHILAQETAIMAELDLLPDLSGRAAKKARKYLQEGFDILRDDAEFAEEITANCRG